MEGCGRDKGVRWGVVRAGEVSKPRGGGSRGFRESLASSLWLVEGEERKLELLLGD